jgi:rubrerythrin
MMFIGKYKCLKCGYRYSHEVTPIQCPKCGWLYCKWFNYEELRKEFIKIDYRC